MTKAPLGLCLLMMSGLSAAVLSEGPGKSTKPVHAKKKVANHAPAKPKKNLVVGAKAKGQKSDKDLSFIGASNKGSLVFQNNGVIQNNVGTPGTSQIGDPKKPDKPSLTVTLDEHGHFKIKAVLEPPLTVLNVVAARTGVNLFVGETLPATLVSFSEEGLTFDQLPRVLSAYMAINVVLPCEKRNSFWFVSLPYGDLASGGIRMSQAGDIKTIQAKGVSNDVFASAVSFIEKARNQQWQEQDFTYLQNYLAKNTSLNVGSPTLVDTLDNLQSNYDASIPIEGTDTHFPWLSTPKTATSVTGFWKLSYVSNSVPDPGQAGSPLPAAATSANATVAVIAAFLTALETSAATPSAAPSAAPAASAVPSQGTASTTTTATTSASSGATPQAVNITVSSPAAPAPASAAASPPKPKVTVGSIGQMLTMTGDSAEIQRLRRLLATAVDIPYPQVRLDMYTFQAVSDVTNRKRAPLMHKDVQTLREGMRMAKDLQDLFVYAVHDYVHGLSQGDVMSNGMGIASGLFNIDVPNLLKLGGFDTNPNRKLSQADLFAFMLFDPARRSYLPGLPQQGPTCPDFNADENCIYRALSKAVKAYRDALGSVIAKATTDIVRTGTANNLSYKIKGPDFASVWNTFTLPEALPTVSTDQAVASLKAILSDLQALKTYSLAPGTPSDKQKPIDDAIKAIQAAQRAIQAAGDLMQCSKDRLAKTLAEYAIYTHQASLRAFLADLKDQPDTMGASKAYFDGLYDAVKPASKKSLQDYLLRARNLFEQAYGSTTEPRLKNLYDHYENLMIGDYRIRRYGNTWVAMVNGQDTKLTRDRGLAVGPLVKSLCIQSQGPNGYGKCKKEFVWAEIRMGKHQPELLFKSTENSYADAAPLYDNDVLTLFNSTKQQIVPPYLPTLCATFALTPDPSVPPDFTDQKAFIDFAKYWTVSQNFDNLAVLAKQTADSPSLTWDAWKGTDVAELVSLASSALDKGLKAAADGLHTDLRELSMMPLVSWEEAEFDQSADGVGFHGSNSIVVSSTEPALQSTTAQTFFQYQQPLSAQQIAAAFSGVSSGSAATTPAATPPATTTTTDTTGTTTTTTPLAAPAATPAATGSGLSGIGALLGLGSGATAANALANLLGTAIAAENPPVYNKVSPGISLAVVPSVLRDGESARLQILLRVTDSPDPNPNQVTTHQDMTTSSNLTTDVNVNELDLFQLTSADFRVTGPVSFPKGLFGLMTGHGTKSEDLDTVVCIQVSILPRSLDLAGKTLILDLNTAAAGGK